MLLIKIIHAKAFFQHFIAFESKLKKFWKTSVKAKSFQKFLFLVTEILTMFLSHVGLGYFIFVYFCFLIERQDTFLET